jgi:hypothetical protein
MEIDGHVVGAIVPRTLLNRRSVTGDEWVVQQFEITIMSNL